MSTDDPMKFDVKKLRPPPPRGAPRTDPSGSQPPKKPPEVTTVAAQPEGPKRPRNPLYKFSLRGKADELEAAAAHTKPLLGRFVMQGQMTMIYAEPNAGKTLVILKLCLDAIHGR